MKMTKGWVAGLSRVALAIALIVPATSSALTIDDIKAQIQSILARIEVLKAQVQGGETNAAGSGLNLPAEPACPSIARTLSVGSRGDDVRLLQRFLINDGYLLSDLATGYFGPLTEEGVMEWQSAHGIVGSGDAASTGFGLVGPKTRAAILAACSQNARSQSARSEGGQAEQARREEQGGSACPDAPAPPLPGACAGSWEKGYDANGCLTGYQCAARSSPDAATTSAPAPAPAPSIELTAPAAGGIVTGGNALSISWHSTNAPRGSVALSLLDADGKTLGTIADNLSASGTYLWRVPYEDSGCSIGESAFDCIAKFARCEGSASLCSIPPGTYAVLAMLSNIASTTSPPFQIAGTAIGSLLQALVGAPVVPPPATETSATGTPLQAQAGACMHEGASYPQGATLSVPCEAGNCPSSGTGYITGACGAGGQWCIPFTSYCSSSITRIDVGAYEGGGAAPIGSGYGINCGSEGSRAYLSCPMGSCKSGFHICRRGTWTYDSSQTISIGGSCVYYSRSYGEGETIYGNPCPAVNGACGAAAGPLLQCRAGSWIFASTGKGVCEQASDGSLDALSAEHKQNTLAYLREIGCAF